MNLMKLLFTVLAAGGGFLAADKMEVLHKEFFGIRVGTMIGVALLWKGKGQMKIAGLGMIMPEVVELLEGTFGEAIDSANAKEVAGAGEAAAAAGGK